MLVFGHNITDEAVVYGSRFCDYFNLKYEFIGVFCKLIHILCVTSLLDRREHLLKMVSPL